MYFLYSINYGNAIILNINLSRMAILIISKTFLSIAQRLSYKVISITTFRAAIFIFSVLLHGV
jgi:hypothetical protein